MFVADLSLQRTPCIFFIVLRGRARLVIGLGLDYVMGSPKPGLLPAGIMSSCNLVCLIQEIGRKPIWPSPIA